MQNVVFGIMCVLVFIFAVALICDNNLREGYKEHVSKSKELGEYVVIPFGSLLNMGRVDKHYFRYKKVCGVYIIYHEEVVPTSVCGKLEKTFVIMPTKRDYKKLYKYLSVNGNNNTNNAVYNCSSDKAMNKIIEHYKEVAEKNRTESQNCINDAVKTYTDIKNRK